MRSCDAKMIEKLFFRLLPVYILIMVVGSLNGIIDSAIAGRLIGPEALAATGLFAPVIKLVETINLVLLGGSQILCGQFLGKNRLDQTRSIFTLDMTLMGAVAVLMTALCMVFPGSAATVLGASDQLRPLLIRYTLGCAPGFIALMGASQMSAFLQLEKQDRRTFHGILLMAASNVGLDLLFVAVLKLGMFGLGLATTISNWVFFAVQGGWFLSGRSQIRLDFHELDLSYAGQILRIGMPGAVSGLFQVFRGIALAYILTNFVGDDGVSAYAAVLAFSGVFFAVVGGVGNATRLLVSVYIGEEDPASLRLILRTALTKGLALIVIVILGFMTLAVPLTRIYYSPADGAIYHYALAGFVALPFSFIMSGIYLIFLCYYQCADKMKIANLLSLFDGFFGMAVPSFLLAPFLGMNGVWLAQNLNGVISLVIIFGYTVLCRHGIPRSLDDYMSLPAGFGVAERDRLDISLTDMEEAVHTSEQVCTFCRSHGIDDKRVQYAGLCTEELAVNILEHGFIDGKKHYVDVRVIYKNNAVTIRLKDDCRAFNPKQTDALFSPEDPARNLGLRIIRQTAKSISYHNTLGLNVTTIVI